MANPLPFRLPAHDYHVELERRLAAAPRDHAEAVLVAYQVLQTAHDQGLLELLQGLAGGRDVIATKLGAAGNTPAGIAVVRNLVSVGKVLAAMNPETLDRVARALEGAEREKATQDKAPGWWALAKKALSAESRRGLGYALSVLAGLGKSGEAKGKK